MYKLDHLLTGVKHPNLACRELNRKYYDFSHGHKYNKKGVDILGEDWDILIILDGCRSDMFFECCDIDGKYETKISKGSNTKEFLYGNFNDETMLDTVYTTANPQFHKYIDEINAEFHRIYNVWNTDLWDEDEGTVLPFDMAEFALEKIKEHPNKRHIIHFLQPHYPFINTELQEIGRHTTINIEGESDGSALWGVQMRGELTIPRERIINAYYENLELALDAVYDLITRIPGKIVITSDHGNVLGERSRPLPIKEWGHPSGIYTSELVEVPWLELERGERPEIHAGEPMQGQEDITDEIIEDRLKNLGYM